MASLPESTFNIEKFDGTNFPFYKEMIYDVLVQKKQIRPIRLQGVEPEGMTDLEWSEMDELTKSTIMLTLSNHNKDSQTLANIVGLRSPYTLCLSSPSSLSSGARTHTHAPHAHFTDRGLQSASVGKRRVGEGGPGRGGQEQKGMMG